MSLQSLRDLHAGLLVDPTNSELLDQYRSLRDGLTKVTVDEIVIINKIEFFSDSYFGVKIPADLLTVYKYLEMPEPAFSGVGTSWTIFRSMVSTINSRQAADFRADVLASSRVAYKCLKHLVGYFDGLLTTFVMPAADDLISDTDARLNQIKRYADSPLDTRVSQLEEIIESGIWHTLNAYVVNPELMICHRRIRNELASWKRSVRYNHMDVKLERLDLSVGLKDLSGLYPRLRL